VPAAEAAAGRAALQATDGENEGRETLDPPPPRSRPVSALRSARVREGGPRTARLALITALVALGLAVPAAQSSPPGGPTIVNGEQAAPGEYPAHGHLLWDWAGDGFDADDGICGGTLVGSRQFLTAAHCVVDLDDEPMPASDFRVDLAEHDLEDATPPDPYTVTAVDVHVAFGSEHMQNDVAMLTLDRAAPYPPLRVIGADESSRWAPGTPARIIGWGATEEGGDVSNVLLEAEVPIVDDEACEDDYASWLLQMDPSTMVCAADSSPPYQDTCQGDSGGPLMVHDGPSFVLVGITSWGNGCARPNYPGVYTRLGAPALNDWVASHIPASPPPPPPPTPPPPTPPPPTPPPPSPPPPAPPPPAPSPPPPPPPPPPAEPAPQPQPRVVRCAVPRLAGKTLVGARRTLTRANCRLGAVKRSYSARVAFGRVIRQQPTAGRRLARYGRVSLVVSRGKRKR
jgi:Trypsin/PASTA domain